MVRWNTDNNIAMSSPMQETDETEIDADEEGYGCSRIEEVMLEDESERDRAGVLKLSPRNSAPIAPPPGKKRAAPQQSRAAGGSSSLAPSSSSEHNSSLAGKSDNAKEKPGTSAVSAEMMRVAFAGWNEADVGPTDSPVEEDIESADDVQSYRSSYPDPQAQKLLLSGRINQLIAILNIGFGLVYLCWRVFRSMNPKHDWHDWAPVGAYFIDPEDPERAWSLKEEFKYNWFCWLLFVAEIFFMVSVWLGHASRCFPSKRTKCTMDELVDIDYELSERTAVCVVIPTRGESLNILREVILNAMSLNLWPGLLDVRKNARLVVVDDRRRAEVLLLIALCYRFAALFCNNRKVRTQLKLEGRAGMSLAAFYDHYLACTAGFGQTYADSFIDIFSIADMIHKMCKDDCIPPEWDGLELPSGTRIEPKQTQTDLSKVPRLREDFADVRSILTLVYFSRPSNEFPASCPVAGMLNSLLFPEDPADANILGMARYMVVNDPRHALQTEFLQRTMPYFFRPVADTEMGTVEYEECQDVAFVQVALRVKKADKFDTDPLSNRDLILQDIINIGRDGVGGAMAKSNGCMYRIDVLKSGKNVRGRSVVSEEDPTQLLGKGLGFSTLTRCEWLPTSVELFHRGFRSVYVNEIDETLSLCFHETPRLTGRVEEVFDIHLSATEVLVQDPLGLLKARYTTRMHRLFVMEDLWQGFFMAMGIELLLLCAVLYSYLWRTPFYTHGIEVLFFFLPYYFTAALPTAAALNWKRTPPDPAFRSVQLSFATAFVPFVVYIGSGLAEMSRVVCSRSGRRQFSVEGCPTWPLYMTLVLLLASMVVTFINWARGNFRHAGLWVTSVVMLACAISMILPTAMRGVKFHGIPSFYLRYAALAVVLVVVAFWQGAGVEDPRAPPSAA